ncbi:unnamed protein product [Closterium sp. NIES-54]
MVCSESRTSPHAPTKAQSAVLHLPPPLPPHSPVSPALTLFSPALQAQAGAVTAYAAPKAHSAVLHSTFLPCLPFPYPSSPARQTEAGAANAGSLPAPHP